MGVSCFHFLMKYKSGYFNFNHICNWRKVSSDVPRDKQGVYIIYKECISFENIIYIGKAGTISQLGIYGKQALYGRINNQQDDVKRQTFFSDSMKANGIHQIIIQWFVTVDDKHSDIPHCIEARLIQKYYKKTKELPLWNRNY